MANNIYRNEKELFKILNLADKRLSPARFKKAIEGLTPSYDLNLIVKKLKEIPVDEEENQEDTEDQYPYPTKPKKKKEKYPSPYQYPKTEEKPHMPPIKNGTINLQDLIDYLQALAAFQKRPFDSQRAEEILNKNYIAYKRGVGFSPTIITEGSSILMSI